MVCVSHFFCNIHDGLESDKFVAGCADDVVTSTLHKKSLEHVCECFKDLDKFASLPLNSKKTQIMPLGSSGTLQSMEIFRDSI